MIVKNSLVILFVLVFAASASAAPAYFEENFNGSFDNPADMSMGGTAVWNAANTGIEMRVDALDGGANRLAVASTNTALVGGGTHTQTSKWIDFDMAATDDVWAHAAKMQANLGSDPSKYLHIRAINWAGWEVIQAGFGENTPDAWYDVGLPQHYSWGAYPSDIEFEIDVQSFAPGDWQVDFYFDAGVDFGGKTLALSIDETSNPGAIPYDLGLETYRMEFVAFEAVAEDNPAWTTATIDQFIATPEPCTMLLLGLGGLLIRKRRV